MEIKIQCDCGQKFKFDVEPVHGQMPFSVNCPVCGVDGTARANVLLQQLLPPTPIPAPSAPPPPPAPAPMRPSGLSISRPHTPPSVAPVLTPAEAEDSEAEDSSSGSVREVKVGWKTWLIIAFFVLWGIVASIDKISQKVTAVANLITWVKELTGHGDNKAADETSTSLAKITNVLPDDDGTMVLVKSSDVAGVTQACVEFYGERNKQKLFILATTNATIEGNFMAHATDNGYVVIDGSIFWEDKDVANLTTLAEFISKKLATTSIAALIGDDAETGVVAIYESGERKFRCDRSIRIGAGELIEDVKLEGQPWAAGLGFKPGEEGWKGFTMYDADALTQQLGFKPTQAEPKEWIVLATTPIKP
ncbi:MAG: hypothetical protein QM813_16530 [Verrucomicrobiota bacterium]